ncbi:nuclear transport factor 2 family protein [Nocardia sp. JMUB6875]|uniref:nuclear transport factor 2 family protein n=1 Tax=Nocardia sp. JMUB6875 TaxID=3158170 RepID=UPI0032E66B0C
MSSEHPARRAGLASQKAVRAKCKDEWLSLFADDARVEDPVGISPYDPVGEGHSGHAAIAAFWGKAIEPSAIEFAWADFFACGDEAAFTGTIRSARADVVVEVDLVAVYGVNAAGKIIALRAFWELDRARVTPVEN